MKLWFPRLLSVGLMLGFGSAQTRDAQPRILGGIPGSRRVNFTAPYVASISAIPRAPLSAEVTYETIHVWHGGTEIRQQRRPYHVTRDSQGRVRVDHPEDVDLLTASPYLTPDVDIYDPVAGRSYRLDTQKRIAYSFSDVRTRAPLPHSDPTFRPDILADLLPLPAAYSDASGKAINIHPEWRRRTLGTRSLEALNVVGEQLIIEVPQGWNGFDQPFEVSIEAWRSREVDMVVLWKCHDPRSGDSTWKLTNVSRREPDPALFRVPAQYVLDDRASQH